MSNPTATATLPAETQRKRRGHDFYPPQDVRASTPALYDTESVPLDDKIITAHYFGGSADWYIAEADWSTGEAFGYADLGLGHGEWGYIDLPEVEAVNAWGGLLIMERDCHWEPTKFSDARNH